MMTPSNHPTSSGTTSTCAPSPSYTSPSLHRSCKGSPDLSSPTTDTMGPDAEYTAHTNFTPGRTLLQTPIKLTLDHGGNS